MKFSELVMNIFTLCITGATLYFTVAIHKSTNRISVITQSRVQRYERICQYCINIVYCAERIYFDDSQDNTHLLLDELGKNVAAIKLTLHRFFYGDKQLIFCAEAILLCAESLRAHTNSKAYAPLKQKTNEFISLCDPYLSVEWARIKKEADGKRMDIQEWKNTFEKYRDDYRHAMDDSDNT